MKAEDKSFYFLASPSYYDIPFFQRAYVWNEENWDELLSNLTSKNQNHFLGSLILKNELVSSGSISRFSVIDGQQRLTTLSILLRACFDHIVKHVKEYGYDEDVIKNCKFSMEILLFVAEGGIKRNLEVKIKHSNIDRKSFESIIHGDFDENDKWNIAAGYGNYRSGSALALGAFYRPNEDTMFSIGGAMGNGQNMVNVGVSLKLGQHNGVSNSRKAMAKEIDDLKAQLQAQDEKIAMLIQAMSNAR